MASPRLAQRWWTAQRFALVPPRVARRALNRDEPRVFCTTLPKSGTHLLERALCLHPRLYRALLPTIHEGNVFEKGGLRRLLPALRPGQVLLAHLPHRNYWERAVVESGARSLLLVRDPRDVVVSEAHYVAGRRDHPLHERFAAEADLRGRIRLAITGDGGALPSVGRRLGSYAGWLEAGALLVRFEDLVGPQGGGDRSRQQATLRAIYGHLGLEVEDTWVDMVAVRSFSGQSPTFRRGRIGAWRELFDDELTERFGAEAGDLLARFGY